MSQARPINRSARRTDLAANVNQGVFSFPEWLYDAQDLQVLVKRAGEPGFTVQNTGFTVTLAGDNSSASVSFASAPRQSGDGAVTVRLQGKRVQERTGDVTRGGTISSAAIERDLDKMSLVLQESKRDSEENLQVTVDASVTAVAAAVTAVTKAGEAAASQAAAATSETNAAASAATATTKASDAAASQTAAATSETNAAASASTATTQAGIATTKAAEALASAQTIGQVQNIGFAAPLVAGDTTTPAGYHLLFAPPITQSGEVRALEIEVATSGSILIPVVSGIDNGSTFSVTSVDAVYTVNVPSAGINLIDLASMPTVAGQRLGIGNVTGRSRYKAFSNPEVLKVFFKSSAFAPGDTLASTVQHRHVARFVTMSGVYKDVNILKAEKTTLAAVNAALATSVEHGWPSPIVNSGNSTAAGYCYFENDVSAEARTIDALELGRSASGSVRVVVATIASGVVTIVSEQTFTWLAGVSQKAMNIVVPPGADYGLVDVSGGQRYQAFSNPTAKSYSFKSGGLANGDTVASSAQHRHEIRWTVSGGLRKTAKDLIAASGVSSLASFGFGFFDLADKTGVVDATSIFANARANHAFPHVPEGVYSVTALPNQGGGFWGPGKPYVNGDRFFLPPSPRSTTLLAGLRARLQQTIVNADVITLVGDSISHFAYAPTGAKHWFNLFNRFANMGIAAGEPTMTALRSSSTYTPAFYGVTYSGPVTTGTEGPIGESAILASGAIGSFTGIYETIGLFFKAVSGSPTSIIVKRGATTIGTIAVNATNELDKYTGDIATGVTTSATYTFEASGGSVEITGLRRLGVKVAGTPNRLLTSRCAHGSYLFNSFGAAAATSIAKQGKVAGGNAAVILALGTNDQLTVAPATIVTNATTLISNLTGGGASILAAILPIRPSSGWDASFTGGRTHDPAVAALRTYYKSINVPIIPADARDWINEGLFQEGLHPSEAGNDVLAQIAVEALQPERFF